MYTYTQDKVYRAETSTQHSEEKNYIRVNEWMLTLWNVCPVRLYVWEPFCIFRRLLLYSWLVTGENFYTKTIFDFNASSNISKATLLWIFPQITQLSFDAEHNYSKEQHKPHKQNCYVLSWTSSKMVRRAYALQGTHLVAHAQTECPSALYCLYYFNSIWKSTCHLRIGSINL